MRKTFTLSIQFWTADRKIVDRGKVYQVDYGCAQNSNSPKHFIAAHQTETRTGRSNKSNIIAVFEIVSVKSFVKNDGARYLKLPSMLILTPIKISIEKEILNYFKKGMPDNTY